MLSSVSQIKIQTLERYEPLLDEVARAKSAGTEKKLAYKSEMSP